jgi:hypothetical protein
MKWQDDQEENLKNYKVKNTKKEPKVKKFKEKRVKN